MDHDEIEQAIATARLLPVLRTPDAAGAVRAAETLLGAGLRVVELTATTPGWAEALAGLRRAHHGAVLGAGTVTTGEDARRAVEAGADFLVSPYPAEAVRAFADETGTVFLEGGFTPAEVAAASGRGIAKLFPAHVGGPAYLRSLLAVLPARGSSRPAESAWARSATTSRPERTRWASAPTWSRRRTRRRPYANCSKRRPRERRSRGRRHR